MWSELIRVRDLEFWLLEVMHFEFVMSVWMPRKGREIRDVNPSFVTTFRIFVFLIFNLFFLESFLALEQRVRWWICSCWFGGVLVFCCRLIYAGGGGGGIRFVEFCRFVILWNCDFLAFVWIVEIWVRRLLICNQGLERRLHDPILVCLIM